MKIGYARVSTQSQNLDAQIDALKAAGCEKIYQEKQSGKDTKSRPELQKMLDSLRTGDTVAVYKLDRLGRSTKDLLELVQGFESKGVTFISVSENIDTSGSMGRLVFQIFAAFAEFERNVARERINAGLASARARGRVGGRKPKLTDKQRERIKEMYNDNTLTVAEIGHQFGVTRQTIYRVINPQMG